MTKKLTESEQIKQQSSDDTCENDPKACSEIIQKPPKKNAETQNKSDKLNPAIHTPWGFFASKIEGGLKTGRGGHKSKN